MAEIKYYDSVSGKVRTLAHFCCRVTNLRPGVRWIEFVNNSQLERDRDNSEMTIIGEK